MLKTLLPSAIVKLPRSGFNVQDIKKVPLLYINYTSLSYISRPLQLAHFRHFRTSAKMTTRYVESHKDTKGPGDARPTALQIIQDEGLEGKWKDKVRLPTSLPFPSATPVFTAYLPPALPHKLQHPHPTIH